MPSLAHSSGFRRFDELEHPRRRDGKFADKPDDPKVTQPRSKNPEQSPDEMRREAASAIAGIGKGDDPIATIESGRNAAALLHESRAAEKASFAEGDNLTEEQAHQYYENREIPEGWYTHGRAGRQDLATGYVI